MPGLKPECFNCIHMLGVGSSGWQCEAFTQIPTDILSLQHKHHSPIFGDHGIQFEAKKTQEAADYKQVSKDELVCKDCQYWIPENACRIVEGTISPIGWCPGYRLASAGLMLEDGRLTAEQLAVLQPARLDSNGEGSLAAAGVMICTADGKVLLVKDAENGMWTFPGGKIEEGETAEQAAIRECEEEIGFKPHIHSEWTRRDASGVDYTTFFSLIEKEFEPKLSDEHKSYQWAPVDDLASASMKHLGL